MASVPFLGVSSPLQLAGGGLNPLPAFFPVRVSRSVTMPAASPLPAPPSRDNQRSPFPMRHLPESDYLALKARWRELVRLAGGPSQAAALTRGCQSRISEAAAPHLMDRFPALDQVADLEAETGDPVVTRHLAATAGFDLSPRGADPGSNPHHMLARVTIECADVQAALAAALADGRISEAERVAIAAEAEQAVTALHALIAGLKQPALRAVKG